MPLDELGPDSVEDPALFWVGSGEGALQPVKVAKHASSSRLYLSRPPFSHLSSYDGLKVMSRAEGRGLVDVFCEFCGSVGPGSLQLRIGGSFQPVPCETEAVGSPLLPSAPCHVPAHWPAGTGEGLRPGG